MKKAPVTNTKPASTTATKATTTGVKPASTTANKATTGVKPAASGVKPASTNIKTAASNTTKTGTNNATKPAVVPAKVPEEKPKQQEQKDPQVNKMKVEQVPLTDLFKKIEQTRDSNKSLLVIDKLEFNDSFTFFKYKGYTVDISENVTKEKINAQTREKSVEQARKQVVVSLKVGGSLVFFLDKMLTDLPDYFKGAEWFSINQLFVPKESQKESYYVKKLLKEEENVDGFGNKGGYYPKEEFATIILSKSTDLEPEELLKKLNMPPELFDCIVIS